MVATRPPADGYRRPAAGVDRGLSRTAPALAAPVPAGWPRPAGAALATLLDLVASLAWSARPGTTRVGSGSGRPPRRSRARPARPLLPFEGHVSAMSPHGQDCGGALPADGLRLSPANTRSMVRPGSANWWYPMPGSAGLVADRAGRRYGCCCACPAGARPRWRPPRRWSVTIRGLFYLLIGYSAGTLDGTGRCTRAVPPVPGYRPPPGAGRCVRSCPYRMEQPGGARRPRPGTRWPV